MKRNNRLRPSLVLLIVILGIEPSSISAADSSASPAIVNRFEADDQAMLKLLDEFAQAWNRHDLDALMSMMVNDCVFEASGGDFVDGERFVGAAAVRASFAAVFERFPDAHWTNARHTVAGDRGWSEWTFTGTMSDGRKVEVNGCDLFTFRDGLIALKNSFRKNRPPLPK